MLNLKRKTKKDRASAEATNRLRPVARLETITGADVGDKTIIPDHADDGYPGAAEKRNTKAAYPAPVKRKRKRATKTSKS